jgi:predicted GIY-YIG superfamily endonuclease
MYYVYILRWNKYYVWCTNNLSRRIEEHKRGNDYFTRRIGKDIVLVWWFEYKEKNDALALETKIKKSWHIERWLNKENFVMDA